MKQLVFLICLLVLLPLAAQAEYSEGIAAVVNDDIISTSDLRTRTNLGILASSLPNTPEIKERLQPQVMNALIDEVLKLQEADRLGITVEDAEVDAGFAHIAEQNNMTPAEFEAKLVSQGISLSSMRSQLRSQIAWGKVVRRTLRPKVTIAESDIDAVLDQIKTNAGRPEYHAAEIFLSVDHPSRDTQVEALAQRLVKQIIDGAAFAAVARQFSHAPGAATGGDIGWIQQGQLPDELDAALQKMQPGQISPPIKTINGYHILFLRDKRAVQFPSAGEPLLKIKQLFIEIPREATEQDAEKALAEAHDLRKVLNSCEDMDRMAQDYSSSLSGDLGELKLSELPLPIFAVVKNLSINEASRPIRHKLGYAVMMVCEKAQPPVSEEIRDQIATRLGLERLEMLQQRYIQDLRATAYIDRRL